jgi:hypothetical protein
MGSRNRVLTAEQIVEICQRYQDGETLAQLGRDYGVVYQSIYCLLKLRGIAKPVAPLAVLTDDPAQCAYFAGFFDGEGSIGLYKHKGKKSDTWSRSISITNSFLPVLELMHQCFGGQLRKGPPRSKPHHKETWKWHVDTKSEIPRVLRLLRPFLMEKAEQADLMIWECEAPFNVKTIVDTVNRLKELKKQHGSVRE